MLKLALFGTSADPPTLGHLAIVNYLSAKYDRVAIWAADNPFKSGQTRLQHRNHMLGLLVQSLLCNNVGVEADLSELRTVHSLAKARARWPDVSLTLVIGADLVPQLPKWYEVAAILAEAELLIMPRSGYEITPQDLESLSQLGARYAIAPFVPPAISSTDYRRQGHNPSLTQTAKPSVTNSIAAYIHQHNLYPCPEQPDPKPDPKKRTSRTSESG
jgi:nicotinate-nucleotide adenylyltransferase